MYKVTHVSGVLTVSSITAMSRLTMEAVSTFETWDSVQEARRALSHGVVTFIPVTVFLYFIQ
jgi:hypothetical protein